MSRSALNQRIPSKRGRPSREEARQIDFQVLEAAKTCFLGSGFDGATMEAIAKCAGVRKMAIYQRHKDKAALFRAVLERQVAIWAGDADRLAYRQGNSLAQRLNHHATIMLDFSRNPDVRAFTRLVEGAWGGSEAIAESFRGTLYSQMLARIAGDILEFASRDGIAVRDSDRAAAMFMGLLIGSQVYERMTPAAAPKVNTAYIRDAVAMFLGSRDLW
ncbi:TetR/AcrR family transcriptional regulator [Sphingomonas tabacisoli]|uniref:TetR/AcrR family transcriptional regulator n=1 Tax=Sphingomonas tabacisoli TaxID=2249466 RepID=A0ABW4I224_9SPHN